MDAKQHRNRIHTAANRASAAMGTKRVASYTDLPEGKEFAKAMAEALLDGIPPEQAIEIATNAVGGQGTVVDKLMTELEPLMKAHVATHSRELPNGRIVHAESYEAKRHEAMQHTQRALSATQDALTKPTSPEKHGEAARAHEIARDHHHECCATAPEGAQKDHEELKAEHERLAKYHEERAKGKAETREGDKEQDEELEEIGKSEDFMKAQVKQHERHLKSGKIVQVGAHARRSPASQKAHEASQKAHEFSKTAESKAEHLKAVQHHGTAQGLHQSAAIHADHPEERDQHMAHAAEHYDMQRGHASMAMAGGGKDQGLQERAGKNLKDHFSAPDEGEESIEAMEKRYKTLPDDGPEQDALMHRIEAAKRKGVPEAKNEASAHAAGDFHLKEAQKDDPTGYNSPHRKSQEAYLHSESAHRWDDRMRGAKEAGAAIQMKGGQEKTPELESKARHELAQKSHLEAAKGNPAYREQHEQAAKLHAGLGGGAGKPPAELPKVATGGEEPSNAAGDNNAPSHHEAALDAAKKAKGLNTLSSIAMEAGKKAFDKTQAMNESEGHGTPQQHRAASNAHLAARNAHYEARNAHEKAGNGGKLLDHHELAEAHDIMAMQHQHNITRAGEVYEASTKPLNKAEAQFAKHYGAKSEAKPEEKHYRGGDKVRIHGNLDHDAAGQEGTITHVHPNGSITPGHSDYTVHIPGRGSEKFGHGEIERPEERGKPTATPQIASGVHDPHQPNGLGRELSAAQQSSIKAHAASTRAHDVKAPFGSEGHQIHAHEARLHHIAAKAHEFAEKENYKHPFRHQAAKEHNEKAAHHYSERSKSIEHLEDMAESSSRQARDHSRIARFPHEHREAEKKHEHAANVAASLHHAQERTDKSVRVEAHSNMADAHRAAANSGKTLADHLSESAHQASSRTHSAPENERQQRHQEAHDLHRAAANFHEHMGNETAAIAHHAMADHHYNQAKK